MHRSNSSLVQSLEDRGLINHKCVSRAMKAIDRANYTTVKDPYHDRPQYIGYSVTISAPHMHAQCLDILSPHLKSGCRALDVGSGSGFLAACMAYMIRENEVKRPAEQKGICYGIDHVDSLVDESLANVKTADGDLLDEGYLSLTVGDGFAGLPEFGPYDCIHVGAAAPYVPKALIEQLKVGGKMVIPVGPEDGDQFLKLIEKVSTTEIKETILEGVRYVPLTTVEHQLSRH